MKLFIGQFATETNTFAAAPTGLGGFEEYGVFHGDASRRAPDTLGAFLKFLRGLAEADGHAVVESLSALAQPAGRTVRHVYEALRDEMLDDLRRAMPVDAIQLLLHGAMAAEGYDDCEGDLVARMREIVGPGVKIGLELDLHCHFTERMRTAADVIIAFKEYPHVDAEARGLELYRVLVDAVAGRVRPVTAVHDCRMMGLWHTTREPMRSFVARMQEVERQPGVLSVSLGHGFPWGDVPEAGAKLWVVTDDAPGLAQDTADRLGREFWALREATRPITLGVDEALDRAIAIGTGPVVLADLADNPGGGAPGDATFILRRLVDRQVRNAVVGAFWDLGAVQICKEAGVGATLDLRVGGKCGPTSGWPVDLRVTVRAIVEDHSQDALGVRERMGTCVWVEGPRGLHLVLASVRTQVYGTDAFTGLGLTLDDKALIVVKSTQHFHAQFAPLATDVLYVSTPGTITLDFANIPFKLRDLNFWPRVEDPHALG